MFLLLAQSSLFVFMIIIFVVAVVIINIRNASKRSQRMGEWGNRGSAVRETLAGLAGKPSGPFTSNTDQAELRLQELARELEGRLDSKLALLEQLTAEADRAAARLERALGAGQSSSEGPEEGYDYGPPEAYPDETGKAPSPLSQRSSAEIVTATLVSPAGADLPQEHGAPAAGRESGFGEHEASHRLTGGPVHEGSDWLETHEAKGMGSRSETALSPAAQRYRSEIHMLADYGFDEREIAGRIGASPELVREVLTARRRSAFGR